jgi:hypothetical protein
MPQAVSGHDPGGIIIDVEVEPLIDVEVEEEDPAAEQEAVILIDVDVE